MAAILQCLHPRVVVASDVHGCECGGRQLVTPPGISDQWPPHRDRGQDARFGGDWPITALQRTAIEENLELRVDHLQYAADGVPSDLKPLVEPGTIYARASDTVQHNLLTAYFAHLVVYVTDRGHKIETDANLRIREIHRRVEPARTADITEKNKTPH